MSFKMKPPPEELTAAFKTHLAAVPAAVVTTQQTPAAQPMPPPAPQLIQHLPAGQGRQRKAPPVVQLNLNVSEALADIISDEAKKAGSTRRWLAKMMKDAGYDVPEADLNPYMNVRKRRG